LPQHLELYFQGDLSEQLFKKQQYFCSELVAYCFIVAGLLDPSAAILYHPATITPGALGSDSTFGTFFGYILSTEEYSVPDNDQFYHQTPFHEIFGSSA